MENVHFPAPCQELITLSQEQADCTRSSRSLFVSRGKQVLFIALNYWPCTRSPGPRCRHNTTVDSTLHCGAETRVIQFVTPVTFRSEDPAMKGNQRKELRVCIEMHGGIWNELRVCMERSNVKLWRAPRIVASPAEAIEM